MKLKAKFKARGSWLIGGALTVLFIFTFWFAGLDVPETINLRSDDQALKITGVGYEAKRLSLVSTQLPAGWMIYTFAPESLARQATAQATLLTADQLYFHDDTINAWREAESRDITLNGRTRLLRGALRKFKSPDFTAARASVTASPPPGAIAYQQFVTYQLPDEPLDFYLPESTTQAACANRQFNPKSYEEQSLPVSYQVTVNGIKTMGHFIIHTLWTIDKKSSSCQLDPQV